MKNLIVTLTVILIMILTFAGSMSFAADEGTTLTPGSDDALASQIIDSLSGGDGSYHDGINGFDIYDHLGYVYMGWRTTGGLWQNHIIGEYIPQELKSAGYKTTDEEVEAPYGTKPASDKSDAHDDDYAWVIKYQGTEDKDLGVTWDPEYSSLEIRMTKDGSDVEDPEAQEYADNIGGRWWAYNPMTEVYQKNFAEEFGIDYDRDIASLESTNDRIRAMRDVLMSSDTDRDNRTGVDDYKYICRESIDKLNKEAELNKRTRLAWESDFTDPPGTDPSAAKGSEGDLIYVGEIDSENNTNSEGIDNDRIKGAVILTDSSGAEGLEYAYQNGGIGVATVVALESYLHPRDDEGRILEPWYDSSRYYIGAGMGYRELIDMHEDYRIVEWQFSYKQYDSTRKLLEKAEKEGFRVTARQTAIGQTYPMTKTEGRPGEGQAVAIAEIKGSLHPEKRILICAHVQEPGCCDNATGVASLLGLATEYKKLIDEGKIARPKCTITFMWGDECNMGDFWMDGHPDETSGLIGALDMDMVGEDPDKTGGVMRIEKTPDPSAIYHYSRDAVPWDQPDPYVSSRNNPTYDKDYMDRFGRFVRLPDSDTIWGSQGVSEMFQDGWYLNDLYRYVAATVTDRYDNEFRVDVCPFEGGSDHETFLQNNIPALLTWHFTDYVYHTSSDTLYMASPKEMENVSLITLTTALMMSDLCEDEHAAMDLLGTLKEAALERMDAEQINTDHRLIYVKAGHESYKDALAKEKEVLSAWGKWYDEAFESVATLVDDPSAELSAAIDSAKKEMDKRTNECLSYAEEILSEPPGPVSIENAKVVLSKTSFTYNGKTQRPAVRTIGGKTLEAGTDYTVKWSDASSKNAGAYTMTITGKGSYSGTAKAEYKIGKAANTLRVKGRTATVRFSKLKKKNQTLDVTKVINFTQKGQGTMKYTLASAKKGKKSFRKYFKVNAKTGKVTIKKGLKKGTYKVKVKVKASGNANYHASEYKAVAFKVKIK